MALSFSIATSGSGNSRKDFAYSEEAKWKDRIILLVDDLWEVKLPPGWPEEHIVNANNDGFLTLRFVVVVNPMDPTLENAGGRALDGHRTNFMFLLEM